MNKRRVTLITITVILIAIIIFDVIIAIKNILTNNLATGILLLVMASIISVATFRNIKIIIKTHETH